MELLPALVRQAMALGWELRFRSGKHPPQCRSLCRLKSFTLPVLEQRRFPFSKMSWQEQLRLLSREQSHQCPNPSSACEKRVVDYEKVLDNHLPKLLRKRRALLRRRQGAPIHRPRRQKTHGPSQLPLEVPSPPSPYTH